jgi:hypothetical protein
MVYLSLMSEHLDTTFSEFGSLLAEAGLNMTRVTVDRRLSLPSQDSLRHLEEFSPQLDRRLLVGYAHSPDVVIHRVLSERGIPTLEASNIRVNGLHFWDVPLGSYPLHSVLHSIAQNVERYGGLLVQVKSLVDSVEQTGLGTLSAVNDRKLLDHFVVAQIDDGPGARVLLAPPYMLNVDEANVSAVTLQTELSESGFFSPSDLAILFDDMVNG